MSEALNGHRISEETKRKISETLKGRKLPPWTDEHRRNTSKSHKGKESGFKGKHHTEEAKRKLSEAKRGRPRLDLRGSGNPMWGKKLSLKTKQKISKALKGRKFTKEHRRKISEAQCGENGHNWKGGLKAVHERIRDSWKYREWRKKCFIRDDYTCRECGARGGYIEVHHIKALKHLLEKVSEDLPLFDLYGGAIMYEPLWDINNGITLCKKCHNEKTKEGGVRWPR